MEKIFSANRNWLIYNDLKKLARALLYLLHNKNKKRQPNKNKMNRL